MLHHKLPVHLCQDCMESTTQMLKEREIWAVVAEDDCAARTRPSSLGKMFLHVFTLERMKGWLKCPISHPLLQFPSIFMRPPLFQLNVLVIPTLTFQGPPQDRAGQGGSAGGGRAGGAARALGAGGGRGGAADGHGGDGCDRQGDGGWMGYGWGG